MLFLPGCHLFDVLSERGAKYAALRRPTDTSTPRSCRQHPADSVDANQGPHPKTPLREKFIPSLSSVHSDRRSFCFRFYLTWVNFMTKFLRTHSTGTDVLISQGIHGWRIQINLREPTHTPMTIAGFVAPTLESAKSLADKEILKLGHVCSGSTQRLGRGSQPSSAQTSI